MKRRFIEWNIPLADISEKSAIEKSVRHGHPSTLHIWWARRPLAASRATNFAALMDLPKDREERERITTLIREIIPWDAVKKGNSSEIIKAQKMLKEQWKNSAPLIIDPFTGGGSIPLEALRLGCKIFANDLNPVAVFIQKATLEWPHLFPETAEGNKEGNIFQKSFILDGVKCWATKIQKEAEKEIGKFYPQDPDRWIPNGYLWARTIPCSNLSCTAEIPLIRHFWLAKKKNKRVAYKPIVDKHKNLIEFIIQEGRDIDFDPSDGTVTRGNAKCLVCGQITQAKMTRKLAFEGKMGNRLIAIILHNPSIKGKKYRLATKLDVETWNQASDYLEEKIKDWPWMETPLPEEELPPRGSLGVNLQSYGLKRWKNLFNERQKLALVTFLHLIKKHRIDIEKECSIYLNGDNLVKAIMGYLTLILGSLADKNATLVVYNAYGEKIEHVFGRTALPIKWDYAELNVFSGGNGDWSSNVEWVTRFISANLWKVDHPITITQESATNLPYPDSHFDAVLTDPPYYDNVPYSDLSDYFYVWFKRAVGDLFPDLFATPLTPKTKEIVANKGRQEKPKEFFEQNIALAFKEMYRILKPDGIAIIVYAHKSTSGWETMLNALIEAGFVVTASWPIQTEMKARLRAKSSAALASSIYIVCRKFKRQSLAFINDIEALIEERIRKRLQYFWNQEIHGGDFFISAIGPAMEIFSRHERVETYSGDIFTVYDLLQLIRTLSTSFLVRKLLKSKSTIRIDKPSQFYLSYRWIFLDKTIDFGDVQNLARSCGINLEDHWGKNGFIKKSGSKITVLSSLDRKKIVNEDTFVAIMHKTLKLGSDEDQEKLQDLLTRTKTLENPLFWQFCQGVSETLLEGNKEKQMLEILLKRMARIRKKTIKPAEDEIPRSLEDYLEK